MDLTGILSCLIMLMICEPLVSIKANCSSQLSHEGTFETSPVQLTGTTHDGKLTTLRKSTTQPSGSSSTERNENCVCGASNIKTDAAWLVVNGSSIHPMNKYPWLVSYYNMNCENVTEQNSCWGTCGGVLISPTFVLTAAHCVYTEDEDLSNACEDDGDNLGPECYTPAKDVCLGFLGPDSKQPGHYRKVAEVIPHPRFNRMAIDNDVALLRLERPVRCDDFSRPICLPAQDLFDVGAEVLIAGTGLTTQQKNRSSDCQVSPEFKEGIVLIANQSMCELNSSQTRNLCLVIGETGQSACQGDSGSAAFQQLKGRFYAVGVTSYIIDPLPEEQCPLDSGAVYTRVSAYMRFIKKHVPDLPPHPVRRRRDLSQGLPQGNRPRQSAGDKLHKRSGHSSRTELHKRSDNSSETNLLKRSGHRSGSKLKHAGHRSGTKLFKSSGNILIPKHSKRSGHKLVTKPYKRSGHRSESKLHKHYGHRSESKLHKHSGHRSGSKLHKRSRQRSGSKLHKRSRQRSGSKHHKRSGHRSGTKLLKRSGQKSSKRREPTVSPINLNVSNELPAAEHIDLIDQHYFQDNVWETGWYDINPPLSVEVASSKIQSDYKMKESETKRDGDELDALPYQQDVQKENLQGDYLPKYQEVSDRNARRPANVLTENSLKYNLHLEQDYLDNIIPHEPSKYDEPIDTEGKIYV